MTAVLDGLKQDIAKELDAEYAGVGWWGLLYRAPRRRRWYRLIPVAELGAEQRADLAAWQSRPRRADLVPVLADPLGDQRRLAGHWFQVVCYESDAERSLAQAIEQDGAAERAGRVAEVLRAFPDWSAAIGPGLVPLPADIVLAAHRPLLLPLPGWGPPSLEQVFAEPERLAYLTPEAARGVVGERLPSLHTPAVAARDVAGVRMPGLYALAVAARSCFEALPAGEAGRLLQRAACAVPFAEQRRDGRLPSWMRRVEQVETVREQLRALTGPPLGAAAADPRALAEAMDAASHAMDPLTAVRSLRAAGRAREAVGLAHAALVDEPGHRLQLLAAQIARQDLDEPFEALSLLERAVQADPACVEARVEQLSIISGLWSEGSRRVIATFDRSFATRLDETARAAFDALPERTRRDRAHEMAGCLIGQGRLTEANAFVHRWLFDGGTLLWWRFELMLDYAETFLLLGRPDTAGQVAEQIRAGLRRVRDGHQMSQAEIHGHGKRLGQLDLRVLDARNRREGP